MKLHHEDDFSAVLFVPKKGSKNVATNNMDDHTVKNN